MAKKREREYFFIIELVGTGKDPDEAWRDAVESFMQDPGTYDKAKKGDFV